MDFCKVERLIYKYVCEYARHITKQLLEQTDHELMKTRDKKRLRLKDSIKTSIKTLYGEVEYKRRYYFDGNSGEYIFLLDQEMGISKVGLFSDNMAKLIVNECLNESFRKAANDISNATDQSISSVGAWKLVQRVGQNIATEEEQRMSDMDRGIMLGAKTVDVLFQEADGVWLNMQKNKKAAPKMELKIATVYEGWKDNKRKELINKKCIAGMENGSKFMHRREAYIRSIYNYDDIRIKLLNGDGAVWIKDDNVTYHQLDQFHMFQEITRKIPVASVRKRILDAYYNKDIEGMLDCIDTYINSIDTGNTKDKKVKNARELYTYLYNNKSGLIKYSEVIDMPVPEEGVVYRGMGVQENQNCTNITLRMKHGRMRWSEAGANNMAKALCSRANGDLERHIEEVYGARIPLVLIRKRQKEIQESAGSIRDIIGKGDKYKALINKSLPILSTANNPASSLIRQLLN